MFINEFNLPCLLACLSVNPSGSLICYLCDFNRIFCSAPLCFALPARNWKAYCRWCTCTSPSNGLVIIIIKTSTSSNFLRFGLLPVHFGSWEPLLGSSRLPDPGSSAPTWNSGFGVAFTPLASITRHITMTSSSLSWIPCRFSLFLDSLGCLS